MRRSIWPPTSGRTYSSTSCCRPRDLGGGRIYRWAGLCLLLLALSPLLVLTDTLVRPLAKSQYVARSGAGLVVAAIVIFIWAWASTLRERLPAFVMLARKPYAARRFTAFALVMLLAILPSDIYLTYNWRHYLDTMREAVRSREGVIAFEDSPLAKHPFDLLVEAWILPSQSLALRARRGDAIIAPPKDFRKWQPFPPSEPYPLG